jgi:hypothetical protein
MAKLSGGGITSNKLSETNAPKREPISHPVSMNRPSQIGLSHYFTPPPIYNKVAASNPVGPTDGMRQGPGANRTVLPCGSQASVRAPTPRTKGKPTF